MKKTIKSLSIIAVLAIASITTVSAQIGIQAGYVNSKIGGGDPYNGFELGITSAMGIQGGFSLQYGLLYSYLASNKGSISSNGHFLNLPVRAAYSFPVGRDFNVFAFAGPNFELGLAGKGGVSIAGNELSDSWYGHDNRGMKRFDLKLGLGAGVQYSRIMLKLGYDWGLLELSKSDLFNIKKNQFTLSVGYLF